LTGYEEADVNQYKRELVAEMKKAYYNLSMADGIFSMLQDTRNVLAENVRVNKRLVDNDKVTRDVLYRSEAELGRIDQEIQEAEKLFQELNKNHPDNPDVQSHEPFSS